VGQGAPDVLTILEGRIEEAEVRAAAIQAYLADETIHSLAIGEDLDYRLLRRMALGRLANRLDPRYRTGISQVSAFTALVERLDPGLGLPGRDANSDLTVAGRRAELASAACAVMIEEGVEAVTHRSVGERAGTPASTVAYHFGSAHDLLQAALGMVCLVAQGRAPGSMKGGPEQGAMVVARGTQSVVLAAARDAALKPYALDLRRLRGENLYFLLKAEGLDRIDPLDAQTAAIVGLGAVTLAGIDGLERNSTLFVWLTKSLRS
jgi:AcrR family transcriptional regulator